jgi:hypothetical protein
MRGQRHRFKLPPQAARTAGPPRTRTRRIDGLIGWEGHTGSVSRPGSCQSRVMHHMSGIAGLDSALRPGSTPPCRLARDACLGRMGRIATLTGPWSAGSAAPGQAGLNPSQVGVPMSPSRRSRCTQREGSATLPGRESGRSLTAPQPDGWPRPAMWGLTCRCYARREGFEPPTARSVVWCSIR